MKYRITVSKTSDGDSDYIQIMSDDFLSVNIVLVGSVDLEDRRPKPKPVGGRQGPIPTRKRIRKAKEDG